MVVDEPDHHRDSFSLQHRFVADDRTADEIAWAWVRFSLRMPAFWGLLAMTSVLIFGVELLVVRDLPAARRFQLAGAGALAGTLLLGLFLPWLSWRRMRKGSSPHLDPGQLLESGFEHDAMVLRSAMTTHRIKYLALRDFRVRGSHVFFRQRTNPLWSVYPRALFPQDAVQAVRRGMSGR